jgi:hypothetical protein
MSRSLVAGIAGVLSVLAIGAIPLACQSGGVGDPCTPEDEYSPQFSGFKVTEENIESRSFQCKTRICLVNHFQGRVSCPLGQDPPLTCAGPEDKNCPQGYTCTEAAAIAPPCTVATEKADCDGYGSKCNAAGKFCQCTQESDCLGLGDGYFCDAKTHQCKNYVCHVRNSNCQVAGQDNDTRNKAGFGGKAKECCVPGTDTPIAVPVCGQCRGQPNKTSTRSADQAVYCSCRCGVADGEADDPNFNFCKCPDGFSCSEIRKNVGLGDPQITGKYCIKENSDYKDESQCGNVKGYYNSSECKGIGQ